MNLVNIFMVNTSNNKTFVNSAWFMNNNLVNGSEFPLEYRILCFSSNCNSMCITNPKIGG